MNIKISYLEYKEVWVNCSQDMALGGLQSLAVKLKRTKMALKVWNKQDFGRVSHVILEIQKRVEVLEGALQEEYTSKVEQDFFSFQN